MRKNNKRTKPIKDIRPSFYLDEDKTQEVKAGGILFYYTDQNNKHKLLLINSRDNYEDFGGRSDSIDADIYDTVSREVEEESNGIFKRTSIKDIICNMNPIYIKHCKYALFLVKLDFLYDVETFGDKELHENIQRTVEWIPFEDLQNADVFNRLNFRLKNYSTFNHISKILI